MQPNSSWKKKWPMDELSASENAKVGRTGIFTYELNTLHETTACDSVLFVKHSH